jgi:hypothetical protein
MAEAIFERRRLTAGQLRTVAERRYGDAQCLRDSGNNERANGVFYIGGFVIECLLKARLLDQFPFVGKATSTQDLPPSDRALWLLIYRSHDLDEMLGYAPDVERKIELADRIDGAGRLRKLRAICAEWSIFARYSPHTTTMTKASIFLDDVKELRKWLKL